MNKYIYLSIIIMVSIYGFSTAVPLRAEEIKMSVQDAVSTALKNNKSLSIKQIDSKIAVERLADKNTVFDADLSGGVSSSGSESQSGANSRSNKESITVSKRFPFGGDASVGFSSDNSDSSTGDFYSSRFSVSFSTPLLQGYGKDLNTSDIKQSEYDLESTRYDLQAYIESLIEQVANAYWDYALSVKKIEIYEESYKLANDQLEETRTRVDIGRLAESELVSAKAELALRDQSMIDVKSQAEVLRLKLLRLMNPGESRNFWSNEIVASQTPEAPSYDVTDVDRIISLAMEKRPDLKQARLSILKGDIDLVTTKNGLLPYLEFFVNLGNTGYSNTFLSSMSDVFDDASSYSLGLNYKYTPGRRSQRSRLAQSILRKEQLDESMANMTILAQEEVLGKVIELKRSFSQLDASRATLALQEEKLRTETEKYRVGKSTALNVAQAQRDLLKSKVDDAAAIYNCHKAIISLERSIGILAEHSGYVSASVIE